MNMGQTRRYILFGVACITSPCCTPILIPVVLLILAGTPAAIWTSQNLGLVYGMLTAVSIASLVLALRWNQHRRNKPSSIRPAQIPVNSSFTGANHHVEQSE